jgi:myo-inositol-1(or 4)-monophosphatase
MTGVDLDRMLDAALAAARAGGEIVRAAVDTAPDAHEKAPGDWVSDADTASERAVRAVLLDAVPDLPVHGEEEGGERGRLGWLVDPIDGTANFLHRFPVVGVSVALVDEGQPIVGVVHAPLLDATYTARIGGGAHHNGVPIRVSGRVAAQSILATGTPFRAKQARLAEYVRVFERAMLAFEDLRRAGAASLDLAWTSAGVFDGYFEQALGPWDVAAGALLVREAGGRVTDWRGDPDGWIESGDIVAASPAVHEHVLAVIADTSGATSDQPPGLGCCDGRSDLAR